MGVLDAVRKVYEEDVDAGGVLVEMVVKDYLSDLASLRREEFNAAVGPWALDRVQKAKQALGRSYVEKALDGQYPGEDVQQTASWLAGLERYLVAACSMEVSKAGFGMENWMIGNSRSQRQVNRDSRGRFTRTFRPSTTTPLAGKKKQKTMSPHAASYTDAEGGVDHGRAAELADQHQTETGQSLTPEEVLRRDQGQWEQLTQFMGELGRGLGSAKDETEAVLTIRRGGQDQRVYIPLKEGSGDKLKQNVQQQTQMGDTFVNLTLQPASGASRGTLNRLAALDTMSAVGGEAGAAMALTDKRRLDDLSGALGTNQYNSNSTGLTRLFDQLKTGGDVLQGIPGAEQYGRFATFVGSVGPEAEKVLGPYVQRAAYRYRGTETSPDKNLIRMYAGAEMKSVDRIAEGGSPDPETRAALAETLTGQGRGKAASGLLRSAATRSLNDGLSGDSLRMQVRSDMAAAELLPSLPKDPIVARLSERAGNVLPSQGLLIDADGKLVSQAVGFAEDHYLPFDLKNMQALRGGQYTRTRQSGGLTGEDVYAAANLGARMVTVASPSGVFTLEMASDFRGARAMTDKAKGMYDRYIKILDAVEASGLYLEDIPAADKQKIENDVKGLRLGDPKRENQLIAERTDEAREKAQQLDPKVIEGIESDLLMDRYNGVPREALQGQDRRRFEDDLSEAVASERAKLTNKLRLNGQGYAVALQTLQQQFPYYIKGVRYEELNAFTTQNNVQGVKGRTFASDRGYVAPGGNRSASTREGYYNPDQGRQFKQRTDGVTDGRLPKPATTPAEGEGATATGGPGTSPTGAAPAAGTTQQSSTPAPNTGVQRVVTMRGPVLQRDAQKAVEALANDFASLPLLQVGNTATTGSTASTGVPDGSNKDVVNWVVSNGGNLSSVMANEGQKLKIIAALADSKAVSEVFTARLVQAGGTDQLVTSEQFGGAKTVDEAAKWVSERARAASDATLLVNPFIGSPIPNADQWQAPSAVREISEISDVDQLNAFAEQNKDLWNKTVELGTKGGDYKSLVTVSQDARKHLKLLDQFGAIQAEAVANAGDPFDARNFGMSVDDMATVLGKPPASYADITSLEIEDEKRGLAAAWQLAMTARVMEQLDLRGEGEAVPKDPSHRLLVAKSVSRVRVLSVNDPLSRAVQDRISKGMPFLPRRRTPSKT